jgi:hypothetical protein
MSDLESLRKRIAEEEARLARVEKERDEALAKLQELKDRLAVEDSAPIPPKPVPSDSLPFPSKAPSTHAEKVVLFRSLFRGREDVFPRLWEKTKTGRKGYSPVCSNEWVRGICQKPRVKCGKCSHRAFLPVTDQVVLDHLQGRHIIGVYPLLPDETCFFLAADFDGPSWQEDVTAFVATCQRMGVPPAIERSRSGKGAHAWFFFSGPVPASVARQMGCYLLTETMSRRHQLGMVSYDRLFPICNSSRTRPGWVEPEVWFRIVHLSQEGHNGTPMAAYREQTVEIAFGPKGAFENGNIGGLTRRIANGRVVRADQPRRPKPPREPKTPRVVELLRKAIEWRRQLDAGEVRTQADIARRSAITERQLRPKIIEAEGARHEGPIASLMP